MSGCCFQLLARIDLTQTLIQFLNRAVASVSAGKMCVCTYTNTDVFSRSLSTSTLQISFIE